MPNVRLTCFADEISLDLEEQLDVLRQEGLRNIELRNLWGKNVLDLTVEELRRIRQITDRNGFGISSIASPIGKYAAADDFAPQLDALQLAIRAANEAGTPYIRLFSYYPPDNSGYEACRSEVLDRMKRLTEVAERNNVILILENDSGLYGDNDDRCLDILTHCASGSLRLAFDAGNFVYSGVDPIEGAYAKLQPYIEYFHVKDATAEPRQFVPAGLGEGRLEELLLRLKERGYNGFLSVEPHLQHYMPHASNPKRVVTAVRALKGLLEKAGMAWE